MAGIMTSVTTLIADYFDGLTREQVFGRQGAFMSFGGVVFLIGGGLAADLHWRATFLVYTVPAVLLWWAARLPEPVVTRPLAMASRTVTSLAETSTMRARPLESRWVSSAMA